MKTLAKPILFLFFLLSGIFVFAKESRPHIDSLNLTGKIFNNNSRVKDVVINIYSGNLLWKSVKVRSSNRFVANLPLNMLLTIEITAEDFHTKRFVIDSSVPNSPKVPLKYYFDIDIFQEKELDGINPSFLDFPVGLVSYDKKKKEFHRNKKYTKRMKKTYLKLWAESQAIERQGKGLE